MKRLLVLMMCAMLAVPSVGMDVSAISEQTKEAINSSEQEKGTNEEKENNEDQKLENTEQNKNKKLTEKDKADAVAEDSAIFINKHYTAQKFTDEEKKAAKDVMAEAAEQLGLKVNETSGKLESDEAQTKFGSEKYVEQYVKEIMNEMVKEGKIIFFSTHILDVAEKLCSRVGIIKKGELVKVGSMDEIKGDESLEKVFLELEG